MFLKTLSERVISVLGRDVCVAIINFFVTTFIASAGDVITEDIVKSVRPGYGLAPKHLPEVLGKRLLKDVVAGQAVDVSFY